MVEYHVPILYQQKKADGQQQKPTYSRPLYYLKKAVQLSVCTVVPVWGARLPWPSLPIQYIRAAKP